MRLIGEGSSGKVWLQTTSNASEQLRAVKVLKKSASVDYNRVIGNSKII